MSIKQPLRLNSAYYNNHTHSIFKQLRADAPVVEARLNRFQSVYLVARYDDVDAILLDNKRFIKSVNTAKEKGGSGGFWMPKALQPLLKNMLNTDEPDHRRLRNLVHKGFTPRRIDELTPQIEAITQTLADEFKRSGGGDFIEAYALPLPVLVIAHLLGIPKEDIDDFRGMVNRFLINPSPIGMVMAIPAVLRFMRYIRKLADKRRQDPQDDLLSALVTAQDEDGSRFTEDELVAMVFLLFVAGHETTVNLIANGTLALLRHPEQFALLKEQPDLVEPAVEEFLRFDGPLESTEMSFASQPVSLHGVDIPQGGTVLPLLLSANRDESVFERPDELDITRSPNRHLAFGKGIHYCLGAPLARLEAKIAFCTLLQEMPEIRLAVPEESIRYRNIVILHRLDALPVVV